jgi:Tol biopolymer transport system component
VTLPSASPSPAATPTPSPSTATPLPAAPPSLSGRIAFPIDDGLGQYDIWMVELSKGEPFRLLPRARQPNFSNSGQLLVNNENSPNGENLGRLDANNTWLGLVSDAPEDRLPFWSPEGDRYVFVNSQLLTDPVTQQYLTYLFIPCSVLRPLEENSEGCRDTGGKSKLVPGDYPVWTADYRIAYLNNQQGNQGVYLVSAGATPREPAGDADPQRLLAASDARPSDTQGNQLFFTAASLAQNWEAHAINLDGTGLVNLSNSPDSQDGLPTVSPDGVWVAFVSDRDAHWGIWVVPLSGGTPQEVVNLSKINTNPSPWGKEDRDWTNERIAWGP